MLLGNYQNLYIYQVDNEDFKLIGVVDELISVKWGKLFNKYFEVVIKAIFSERNIELLKKGNIIWAGGENAAVIDVVEISEEEGKISLQIKGQTLEKMLAMRIVLGGWNFTHQYVSEIMEILVNRNCVVPYVTERALPYFDLSEESVQIGEYKTSEIITNYPNLYDKIKAYADASDNIGFKVLFRPDVRKIIFKVFEINDHTISSNNPVIFSSDMENIINMEYYTSNRDYKNVATVLGEGEGLSRKKITIGDVDSVGYDRYEHSIDARDLQSETDSGSTISDDEYKEMLRQRGLEKLADLKEVETVSGKLNLENNIAKLGVDYDIGDMITVVDNNIGLQINAQVTGIQETTTTTYSAELTVGYDLRTLSEKIKNLYG